MEEVVHLPVMGDIVMYVLTDDDANQVMRRRTQAHVIAAKIEDDKWPKGAQAHLGNPARAGQILPMIIVAVWPDEGGPGRHGVNGKVFLDGTDVLWVTSRYQSDSKRPPGTWHHRTELPRSIVA